MIRKLIEKINSRIAHKLVLWVIVFSVIITLLNTAIQLYIQYRQELVSIEEYFDSITSMQLNSLSQSVWIMDARQIQAHLDGITKGRDIIYAAVNNEEKPLWSSGQKTVNDTLSLSYELSYLHRNTEYSLGTLEIVAGLDNLYQRLTKTAFVVILTNSLKIFILAGCILLYFRYAVARHLEKLASHVVGMDFRRRITPLDLNRAIRGLGDELSQVVNMLNVMQRRGYNAFHALEKSEQRLRLFFDATEEGIFGITSEGRITFANSTCLNMIGYERPQQIIGQKVESIISFFAEADEEIVDTREIFLKPLRTGRSLSVDDGYMQISGGPSFYAAVRTYPIVSGNVSSGAVIFFNDISPQREMLKEKNLLSQAVRQSPLLVIISDAMENIEYVNPGFERLTGYSLKEVVGRKASNFGRHKQTGNIHRDIRETLQTGEKWQGLYLMRAKDGMDYTFDTQIFPVFNGRGKMINTIALWLDITQKVELQNQLNHAQKMEAVSRLSASFAHEFGNPLLGVRSVIKDIGERIPMEKGDKELLDLAYTECERMKILIRNFQRFQSTNSDKKELQDIHAILENVLFFYKKHFERNNIVLKKKYHADLPLLFLSKNQITQAFLNLIINAVDSMADGGGTLEVSTGIANGEIYIHVKDSGVGIGGVEKDLIFEPFYSTKPDVQGTGLGLPVSYGIVAGHGGEITFSSQKDEGSVFTVRFPQLPLRN
ncbi:PAS domain S-box protein [Desulfopila inferna]|uniref:PAS domain S-box protein n=1 Tax=Desulfopila inferna TaxID=468528 RepID=UPI00196330C4|nr:PAS domain S-box protein [Desulfopila inferna]MBM9605831.1 PAS domain S-box protein [Desulfopila inferna]